MDQCTVRNNYIKLIIITSLARQNALLPMPSYELKLAGNVPAPLLYYSYYLVSN